MFIVEKEFNKKTYLIFRLEKLDEFQQHVLFSLLSGVSTTDLTCYVAILYKNIPGSRRAGIYGL